MAQNAFSYLVKVAETFPPQITHGLATVNVCSARPAAASSSLSGGVHSILELPAIFKMIYIPGTTFCFHSVSFRLFVAVLSLSW